jgi:hypothetical protein
MKLIKKANGKQILKMSKLEWNDLGNRMGWVKLASTGEESGYPIYLYNSENDEEKEIICTVEYKYEPKEMMGGRQFLTGGVVVYNVYFDHSFSFGGRNYNVGEPFPGDLALSVIDIDADSPDFALRMLYNMAEEWVKDRADIPTNNYPDVN